MNEAKLVDRREELAAGVTRDDVVDARSEPRARRGLEVELEAAELAEVAGASAELGHEPSDVIAPAPMTESV